jgi:hypothetical protein
MLKREDVCIRKIFISLSVRGFFVYSVDPEGSIKRKSEEDSQQLESE